MKRPATPSEARVLVPRKAIADLRDKYVAEDWPGFHTALKSVCSVEVDGCWLWTATRKSKGYAFLNVDRRRMPVHRMSLHAKLGVPLGSLAAHHACANTACVNPDHLQAITAAENTAEMMERQAYLSRIAALEAALSEVSPNHLLLST